MSLFTKKIGPIFLKENSSTERYIKRLEELLSIADETTAARIKKQIYIAKSGLIGETNIAFELKNSGMDMYILHDIYLKYGDLSAQIDYLVVTRKRIYVIECKNLIGDIEIDNTGSFIRSYELAGKKIREGTYSPITQNERHLHILKEVRKESKNSFISKTFFEKNFANSYKSLVVLANPKTVLSAKWAKKEIKEQILRVDQLINKIRLLDESVKDSPMTQKEMLEIANFYLSKDHSGEIDYAKTYEEMIENAVKENESKAISNDREELVKELKAFRKEQSIKENIKAYYIFNDAQMEDLITKNPKTKEELLKVSGFGDTKVVKYGDGLLTILQQHNRNQP